MNLRKTVLAVTGAAFISLSLAAFAAAVHNADEKAMIRLSEDGAKAAQSLLLARIAIFDGQTQDAVKLVDQAKAALVTAAQDADKLAIKSQKNDVGPLVPIDARLTVADDFVLSPEKKEQIDQVNEHLKKGETKKAVEVLSPADESMTLTTLFMPLEATSKAVDEAATLLGESKYYEANLALKKAEDSWVSESQSFVDYLAALPKAEPKAEKAAKASAPEKATPAPQSGKAENAPNS
ncbi:MAG: YfdX family protein [Candidatus Competibacteraceae bacterium]|nr:YfdX family protein [Candidatus Competibacteraceae bacterium]MCB1821543.1 YfdX family protein [Candidatus Competibacteraceae bacterium]